MYFATLWLLCLRSRSFLLATILFAGAFGIDVYIAVHYWAFLGARIVCVCALPIGLQLPLLWWRLGQYIARSHLLSPHIPLVPSEREPERDATGEVGMDLSGLSFWIAFIPCMCLLFLLFVLGRFVAAS